MLDTNDAPLPTDFLVDAELYPLDLDNGLYISLISVGERKIYIADSVTNEVFGVAEYVAGDTLAIVREDTYDRQVGVLVFGDGLSELARGGTEREFTADATAIVPTAFIQLNQTGVRGILLEDGTLITGDVIIEGRDGVNVISDVDAQGFHRLRFDMVGELPKTEDDCTDAICPRIVTLRAQRVAGSAFTISALDDCTLALWGHKVTLDQLCEIQRNRTLPDEAGNLPLMPKYGTGAVDDPSDDPCDPVPPVPPVPVPDLPIQLDFAVGACDGNFSIVAPTTSVARNLLHVMPYNQANYSGASRLRITAPIQDASDLSDRVSKFRDPDWSADGLVISMRGLPASRRGV